MSPAARCALAPGPPAMFSHAPILRLLAIMAWFLAVLLPWRPGPASAADPVVPYLSGRVVDEAEILDDAARASLSGRLKTHEEKTGNQIAVLTVNSLGGANIEDYAVAVFAEWKLGQAGKDNGLLLVVAPSERRMRIEVGYGLEGTLTDGTAGRIIHSVITPRFKDGDFAGGISEGVDAVVGILEGGAAPASIELEEGAQSKAPSNTLFEGPDLSIPERILIGSFVFGIIGLFTVIGVLTPGVGWFLYLFLIPFWAMFPIIIVGTRGALTLLVIYLVSFPIAKLLIKRTAWYRKAQTSLKRKGRATIGGFTMTSGGSGSSWSSGSSGSSSSSSSFSGGGGSSGGGGASGSW